MIRRLLLVGLLLVAAAVLETALFPALSLLAVRTDLLLLVVVAFGLRDGPVAGMRVGFAAGLLADLLLSQSPVGLSVLVFTVLGYLVGMARPYLAPDSWTAPILISAVAGLLGTAAYGTLARLLGDERVTTTLILQASLTVAMTSALLAPVVVRVVTRLTDAFPLRGTPLTDHVS
jgi:rod shape-determining protein MreD